MKFTVVGCSGSMAGPDAAASCYLVEHDGFRLVMDLGNGALGSLQRFIDIAEIDAVALSHLHADHWLDLTTLHVAVHYGPYGVSGRIPVFAPPAAADRLALADGQSRSKGPHSSFDFHDVSLTATIGPFRVRTARTAHPIEAFAIRLEAGGRSLVYSGDSGPCQDLVDLADGADLFVAEASFVDGQDNPANLHMTGRDAGAAAREAAVGHLVVTHIPPWHDGEVALAEARSTFSGATTLATPGWSLDLNR